MTDEQANHRNKIWSSLFAVIICLFCVFTLCACNNDNGKEEVVDKEYNLYFSGLTYSPEDGVMHVDVTLSGDEENKLQSTLDWHSRRYAFNVWYNAQDVNMILNPTELYAEIDDLISDDQRVNDGVEYNRLKVLLRYDTIYKSLKSDGIVEKNGRNYMHRFDLDEDSESQICFVWLKTQNSASWYSLLIACGIIFTVIAIVVMLSIKGGVWQKKKKKNE